MILEHAVITIRPGTANEFERAFVQARRVISSSPGFISLALHRGVEVPERYLLLVSWATLEDHLERFRQSDAFTEWRALIGPYFETPPVVDHAVAVSVPG